MTIQQRPAGQARRFLHFVTVALLLFVVALASAVLAMHFAIHGAEATMPDLRGMTESMASGRTAGLDLTVSVDGHFYSADVAAGRVLTQSPLAGTKVRRGSAVRVTESLGPQKTAAPELVGQQQRIAIMEVRRAGLTLRRVARMPYAAQAPDTVIAQAPLPDAAKLEDPEINLLLSMPAPMEGKAYVMPDLVHQNEHAAAAAIARTGLKLEPVIYRDVAIPDMNAQPGGAPLLPVVPGTVLAQLPPPGQRVTAGTAIELTVAR